MFVFDFRFDRVDLDFDFGTNVSCFLFRGTSQIESRLHKGWDDPNRAVLASTPGDCIDNRIRCNENRDWCIVGPETRIAADLREARNAYDNRVVALRQLWSMVGGRRWSTVDGRLARWSSMVDDGRLARVITYMDELIPGNPFRPDKARKLMCICWAIVDWLDYMLNRRFAWPCFSIIRSSLIGELTD